MKGNSVKIFSSLNVYLEHIFLPVTREKVKFTDCFDISYYSFKIHNKMNTIYKTKKKKIFSNKTEQIRKVNTYTKNHGILT